ncbi:Mor transcription activator family protein [Paucibacter sp. APW11]|uniref:Mor transcription activator family protein n=1 Tax=Roseateles aquae TaxID=3077235 RepID=A0ABU3P732_9BURK|nr:Mor transcription activator family protein [Paucibacter sp. APW11]MDT8998357.1 Mor transcription activator family protein [Paucibacter sp. APW11]
MNQPHPGKPNGGGHSPAMEADCALQLHRELREMLSEATGLHGAFADNIAAGLLGKLRERYGGERLYVPMPERAVEERNAAMRALWRGDNVIELVRKFRVSRATVYRVCKSRG